MFKYLTMALPKYFKLLQELAEKADKEIDIEYER